MATLQLADALSGSMDNGVCMFANSSLVLARLLKCFPPVSYSQKVQCKTWKCVHKFLHAHFPPAAGEDAVEQIDPRNGNDKQH